MRHLDFRRFSGTVGDEFRFIVGGLPDGPSHRNMLDDGETATSAGMCVLDDKNKEIHLIGESMTLQLKPAADDAVLISRLFFQN